MLDLLYPEPACCPLCGVRFAGRLRGWARPQLCPRCLGDIAPLCGPLCRVCGRAGRGALCADCAREPHDFFLARAYAGYEGSVQKAIKALKYQGDRDLIPILGGWLAEAYIRHFGGDRHMRVVPVPMHPVKQMRRGFNQADELARFLCRELRLQKREYLRRIRLDQSQTTSSRAERLRAMEGAFQAAAAPPPARGGGKPQPWIAGECVLLIDDVLTTGGTADACARELFAVGAVSVYVLTVAR